ncbi:MAG: dihydrodipicolinate synthase family protein [Calditrichaeota bacterium]|nr:MAG: dihydrodipicolinate synthase family protein [Calditrichota bacterium]
MSLQGLYCPITTPFVDERISFTKLAENLEKWNRLELAGYVVLGSTGENVYLSPGEKLELVRIARENIPADRKLIVGAGCESTAETEVLIQKTAERGADAVLVITPHYYKGPLLDRVLSEHFLHVAETSPLPVIVYNVPKFTGVDVSAAVVKQLRVHPKIVGIKESTNDFSKLTEISELSSDGFGVLVGNAAFFYPGLVLGAQGAVLALANFAGEACLEIYRAFSQGSQKEALRRFLQVRKAAQFIIGRLGIPGIKAAMDLSGYYGGAPRRPLLPLAQESIVQVKQHLADAQLL